MTFEDLTGTVRVTAKPGYTFSVTRCGVVPPTGESTTGSSLVGEGDPGGAIFALYVKTASGPSEWLTPTTNGLDPSLGVALLAALQQMTNEQDALKGAGELSGFYGQNTIITSGPMVYPLNTADIERIYLRGCGLKGPFGMEPNMSYTHAPAFYIGPVGV